MTQWSKASILGKAKAALRLRSAEAAQHLLQLRELPPEVLAFGRWMLLQEKKQLGPRDIIKAFIITRSSVQRMATTGANLRRTWPDHPWRDSDSIRPEDAFSRSLLTPLGKRYLDLAEAEVRAGWGTRTREQALLAQHQLDEAAKALAWRSAAFGLAGAKGPWELDSSGRNFWWEKRLMAHTSPVGFDRPPFGHNLVTFGERHLELPELLPTHMQAKDGTLTKRTSELYFDLREAVTLGRAWAEMTYLLRTGTDQEWMRFVEQKVNGVSAAKAGFLASLLGRGSLPTGDAREIRFWWMPWTWTSPGRHPADGGAISREFVWALQQRLRDLQVNVPAELQPHYQHLVHHALWDRLTEEGEVLLSAPSTTHAEIMQAMDLAGLEY